MLQLGSKLQGPWHNTTDLMDDAGQIVFIRIRGHIPPTCMHVNPPKPGGALTHLARQHFSHHRTWKEGMNQMPMRMNQQGLRIP